MKIHTIRPLAAAGAVALLLITSPAGAAPASPTAAAALNPADALPDLGAVAAPRLPTGTALAQVLEQAPLLRAAQSQQQAAQHSAQALIAGSNEFTAQAQLQQRRIEDGADSGRYAEWQVLFNRPLRLPSQAAADRDQADATVAAARSEQRAAQCMLLAEAMQQWFAWQRAQAQAELAAADADLLQRQLAALQRRQQLGDASVLEVEQLQAEVARARSALLLAQGEAASSRAALARRYPALAEVGAATGEAVTLTLPPQADARLIDAMQSHSPEVLRAEAAWRQAQASAAQAKAARTPQPTVGAYLGSDRGGRERIVGVQFAMPIGGPARDEQEQAAFAAAETARWQAEGARLTARAEAERLLAQARAQIDALAALDAAVQAQRQASTRLLRGVQLGELGLADWLLARRATLEAMRQLLAARFDAAQSLLQLRLQSGEPVAAGGPGCDTQQ